MSNETSLRNPHHLEKLIEILDICPSLVLPQPRARWSCELAKWSSAHCPFYILDRFLRISILNGWCMSKIQDRFDNKEHQQFLNELRKLPELLHSIVLWGWHLLLETFSSSNSCLFSPNCQLSDSLSSIAGWANLLSWKGCLVSLGIKTSKVLALVEFKTTLWVRN